MFRRKPLLHHHLIVDPEIRKRIAFRYNFQSLDWHCKLQNDVGYLELWLKSFALYNRVIQFSVCIAKLSSHRISNNIRGANRSISRQMNWRGTKSMNDATEKNTSCLLTNNSKRSVKPGFDLCHFAKGLIISGWLMMKAGFTQVSSRKCPTSCRQKKYNNMNLEQLLGPFLMLKTTQLLTSTLTQNQYSTLHDQSLLHLYM